ncbi:MAG TPA: F0F1 ATP synthase subunit delta [Candidatus Lumbricidophila sp.]|nr:F0F1 ATP synthase subunit delta [Candidatus Lumbricidophila sp.]
MGSATIQALAGAREAVASLRASVPVAEDILKAGRLIGATPSLRAALTDNEASAADKAALVSKVFGSKLSAEAVTVLTDAASRRWSSGDDFLGGLEDLGVRVAAKSDGSANVDEELFAVQRTIAADAELELAIGSKLGSDVAKRALVDSLFSGKISAAALAIVQHLIEDARGRRVGAMLQHAASVVADQQGFSVATVHSAVPLSEAQLARLGAGLAKQAARDIRFNTIVDPSLIGGVRVQIGADVIDGSVAKRLADLRLQLAG